MTIVQKFEHQKGFTLIEIMVAMSVFLVICGAMFSLVNMSQKRFRTESQVLDSFQQARLGLDEVVRDASDAGFPPQNQFSFTPPANLNAITPVAWSPNYAVTPCLIGTAGGGTCTTPGDFDVIFEEKYDNTGVNWIRYTLQGTTLFRGVWPKVGANPAAVLSIAAGNMFPYVTNVMNNASAAQIAAFRAAYPTMFPGGNPQPIFQYYCDTANGPVLCQNAGAPSPTVGNSPQTVRDVEVTLIVRATRNDAQTRAPRLVELNGRGHRLNPNQ
ncbi:MAG: type II secretion system protein [Candidatus Acidiferrales bacterium]